MNDYKNVLISQEELANYIQLALNSEEFKNVVKKSSNISKASSNYEKLSTFLINYAIATGDLSIESMNKIISDFSIHSEDAYEKIGLNRNSLFSEEKLEAIQLYFQKYILPLILEKWQFKLNLHFPLSLVEMKLFEEAITNQCKNNRFFTHSFSGALYDEVVLNGLNISKELFQDEYQLLSFIDSDTPFTKGKLCFCELSLASFGYALFAPERLRMALIDTPKISQENDETIQEYQQRCLISKTQKSKNFQSLTQIQKDFILLRIKKMIGFYFGQHYSCIAVFKDDKHYYQKIDILHDLNMLFMPLKYKIMTQLREDEELKNLYDEIRLLFDSNDSKAIDKLQEFIDIFNKKYPENKTLNEYIMNSFVNNITNFGLNNFMHLGNANGYVTDEIKRENFSVVTFPNPIDLYALHKKGLEEDKVK